MTSQILGVARTLPFHSIGGMQAIAWDLFRQFAYLGHTVTVITTAIPGRAGPFVVDGVTVIPLPGTQPERANSNWWRASQQWYLNTAPEHWDGVLSISSAAATIAALPRTTKRPQFVFQAHGTSWGELLSKWRTGRPLQWAKSVKNLYWLIKDATVYPRFDHIALVGDVLNTQFASPPVSWITKGISKVLIRNGVSQLVFVPNAKSRHEERQRLGWSDENRVAVFAARLHPQKGGEVALRAFAQLAQQMPHARLLIIGGGEDLNRLQLLCKNLGCEDLAHFTGPVARERMAALLNAGDAFVFPTLRQEGLPMNVLEALACGLHPVCSQDTRTVFDAALPIEYADPQNVGAFSTAMKKVMQNAASTHTLLTHDYVLDTCAKKYLDILQLPRAKA